MLANVNYSYLILNRGDLGKMKTFSALFLFCFASFTRTQLYKNNDLCNFIVLHTISLPHFAGVGAVTRELFMTFISLTLISLLLNEWIENLSSVARQFLKGETSQMDRNDSKSPCFEQQIEYVYVVVTLFNPRKHEITVKETRDTVERQKKSKHSRFELRILKSIRVWRVF